MAIAELIQEIETRLRAAGTPERALQEKRYLKSDLDFLGANVPQIREVARSVRREHPDLDRAALLEFVDLLWRPPVHELRTMAVDLLNGAQILLQPDDMNMIERLLRESKTWALVDDLSVNVAGGMVERAPKLAEVLDRWAQDQDFWIRRASLLALLLPLRRGGGDFMRFGRYADAMLDEREFFIRKAIGWVLREVSKKRPELVFNWLLPRTGRASGVTVREAVKYLPCDQRDTLLREYGERRRPKLH